MQTQMATDLEVEAYLWALAAAAGAGTALGGQPLDNRSAEVNVHVLVSV